VFSGVEIPSNRTLLEKCNVTHVMLNYWGLRKRGLPKTKQYLVAEHFLPDMKVWIDSGATQADKSGMSKAELEDYAADYEDFISYNYDRIEGWVEFDSQVLGLEWVLNERRAFQKDPKHIIVWHESYGVNKLQQWAPTAANIAIPGDAVESVTSLAGITRNLTSRYGTKFHGLAIAKPDNLRQIPFVTTSTLSWLSPMRRGETIIWDNNKLVRYPKKMKDQARLRYKSTVEKAGLDYQKFVNDDTLEATKVAVWSYLQLEKTMDRDKPDLRVIKGDLPSVNEMLADNSDETLMGTLVDLGWVPSDNSGVEKRKVERSEVVQRDPSEVTSMPVMGYQMKTIVETENGRDILKEVPIVQSNTTSLRQCNTCFVAANCPAFIPDNTCGFNLPVKVESKEQLQALNTAMLEMQAQRVMFMRFQEELNGGYADPNLSQEIDRYQKMLKNIKELDESKEFIQITAQRSASQGVLSAIFGDRAQAIKDAPPAMSEEKTTMIIKNAVED
jgi:hypothetical protein